MDNTDNTFYLDDGYLIEEGIYEIIVVQNNGNENEQEHDITVPELASVPAGK